MNYYIEIPLLGLAISIEVLSGVLLYIVMIAGMLAKTIWDQTEQGKLKPNLQKIIRPLLVSPITFSAFWGPMYLQQDGVGISMTSMLYAFQIGFMWQYVLERKLETKAENKQN